MSQMTDFRLSCCRLLEQFPLYDYRSSRPNQSGHDLFVLLLGYGSRMDTILRAILTQGQLLHTGLDVTLANTNADGTFESLCRRAPALEQFVRLIINARPVSQPEASLCTLRFDDVPLVPEAMERVMEERCEASYVIISTGDDEKNRALAEACARFETDHRTLIAYVQKKAGDVPAAASPLTEVHAFHSAPAPIYRRQLEQIALNMHYTYEKQRNERACWEDIAASFRDDYSYAANLESALHVRSKLACCGITCRSPAEAADQFSRCITGTPALVDQLSALEHQRWMMSKLLDGYRPMERLSQIYCGGAGTHSSEEKWHSCLVPCDPEGQSRLTDSDWDAAPDAIRPELDPLDRLSLQIHAQCRLISEATRDQVDGLLQAIRKTLTDSSRFSDRTRAVRKDLQRALTQIRQHKQSAISLYYSALAQLKAQVRAEGAFQADLLLHNLESLEEAVRPLLEYVSRKDYKRQDRVLVQQIPFALTHKTEPVLLKVLSEKNSENLLSFWQLEPRSLVFCGAASTVSELLQIEDQAKDNLRFIRDVRKDAAVSYFLCVPTALLPELGSQVHPDQWNCRLIAVEQWTLPGLTEALSAQADSLQADYLDITGGEPLLTRALERCAEALSLPIFYTRHGRMHNLRGARELEYQAPVKGLTVNELFRLSGAVVKRSEAQKLSDLSSCYLDLWNIQQAHSAQWTAFCAAVSVALRDTPKKVGSFVFGALGARQNFAGRVSVSDGPPAVVYALLPSLRQAEALGYLSELSAERDFAGFYTLSCLVDPAITQPKQLEDYLKACFAHCEAGYSFSFHPGSSRLSCIELDVENMPRTCPLPNGRVLEYFPILNDFDRHGLIRDYQFDVDRNRCSFELSSRDILEVLQKSGTILEYLVYYTALYDAHFTDVDMGYEFMHSDAEDAARNEVDVICTKGSSSLFISAKLCSPETLRGDLNYILYEISLISKEFGLNSRAVLAAPALHQFDFQPDGTRIRSGDVCKAMSRGVYLLGDACFRNGALGEVLDRIMDGEENWCDFL